MSLPFLGAFHNYHGRGLESESLQVHYLVMAPRTTLLSLGEIVWDVYPDRQLLGGAPFNVAAHAARLGFDARLLSGVGDDELGRLAVQRAAELGVDMSLTRVHPEFPTGVVGVTLDAQKQPTFHLRRPAAWEEPLLAAEVTADWLVCGTLQQIYPAARRVRERLRPIPLFYDINLRPGFEDPDTVEELLRQAKVVKCNESELRWLAERMGIEDDRNLLRQYPASAVCVTLGARGCRLLANGERVEAPAPAIDTVDTVGAGDAFSAALLFGFVQQWPLDRTAEFANRLGSLVASRQGAIPEWSWSELGPSVSFSRSDVL
ncbi:MAG: carbohydrate kinase [Acidobacteria bacterium]|nr:carbohydrate kinase [Acidobacteriota bacterium]